MHEVLPSWLLPQARVEARWGASSVGTSHKRYYPGVIDAVHNDGTCAIRYDDGDYEDIDVCKFGPMQSLLMHIVYL